VIDAAERIGRDKGRMRPSSTQAGCARATKGFPLKSARPFEHDVDHDPLAGRLHRPGGSREHVLDALKQFGGMRAVANIFRTEGGNDINYPTSDGTRKPANCSRRTPLPLQLDLAFGVVTLSVYKYSSKVVACRSSCCRTATSTSRRLCAIAGHSSRPHHEHALHDRHRLGPAERHRDRCGLGQGRHSPARPRPSFMTI
jgi:hypothetical protein